MERELFEWKNWDSLGCILVFTNCKLKQNIGKHSVGEEIPIINWDLQQGSLELILDPETNRREEYKVKLTVTEQIL